MKLLPDAAADDTAAVAATEGVLLRIAGELVRDVEETEDCDGEEWLFDDEGVGIIFFLIEGDEDDDNECLWASNVFSFCFPVCEKLN